MENYKTLLEQQKQALANDIAELIKGIKSLETDLESLKERKSLAQKELRAIEKRLAKIN